MSPGRRNVARNGSSGTLWARTARADEGFVAAVATRQATNGGSTSGLVDTPCPPPEGLSAQTVVVGDDEYLIMSFPLPVWNMPEHLTEAERSVTLALLRGDTNEQVACDRNTSVHTVANQVARIFTKLGVGSRIELAHRIGPKGIPSNDP